MKSNTKKNEAALRQDNEETTEIDSVFPRGIWFLLTAWVVYVCIVAPAWNAPFIFDDGPGIVENPAIASSSLSQILFSSPSDVTPYGRPMVSLSLAINQAIAGYTPWFFRFFNLVLHGLNAVLVYALLRNLMALSGGKAAKSEPVAIAAATLWLFHPLGTNVSLYIVQRAEGLVIFFLLLTLYSACRALGKRVPSRLCHGNRDDVWPRWTVTFCALGMLSKESMVIAPVAVYLLDVSMVSRSFTEPLRRRWRWYAALASTWLILVAVMLIWPRRYSVGTESGLGALQYFVVQMEVLGGYLLKAVWPAELHLDYWIFEPTGWLPVVIGFVVLLVLFVISSVATCKGSPFGYLGLLAFLVLAPTSTFIPVRSMPGAEYRFYLPALAVISAGVLVAWMLSQRVSSRYGRDVFLILIVVWGIGLAFRTHLRAQDFDSPEKIWSQVRDKFPKNVRALNALGNFAMDANKIDKAREFFQQSIEFHPEHGDAYANLGMLEGQSGNLEMARVHLEKSVELWPFSASTWSNLGITHVGLGNRELSEEAFLRALRVGPHLPEPNYNLGILYLQEERWDEGRAQIRRTLQLDPHHPGANSIRQQLISAGKWSDR